MDIEIEKLIEKVRVVDSNRNYWFIRTYGGKTYNDFFEKGYVGIGLNKVPYEYIENCKDQSVESYEILKGFIETNTELKGGEVTKWTNQLIAFQHTVKEGDLVIIPDKNSKYFSIGIVQSDVYVVKDNRSFFHDDEYVLYPEKRRQVIWEKTINKLEAVSDIRGMTSTHLAISLVNKYSEGIEGFLSSIYIKEEKMHLVIKVNQDEDINAFDLNDFLTGVTYFYKEFCEEEGIKDDRDLIIKIKLQSKGKLALQASVFVAVMGIAGLIAVSNSPEFKVEIEGRGSMEFKSDGLLKSYSDFLDAEQERKIQMIKFMDSINNLKADGLKDALTDDDIADNIIEEGKTDNGE